MSKVYECPYCGQYVMYKMDSDAQNVTRGRGKWKTTQYFHKSCYMANTRGAIDALRLRDNASRI